MKTLRLNLPLCPQTIRTLEAGDKVLLSGVIHTARDEVHQRMKSLIELGQPLPLVPRETSLFYCGPSPTPPERICGAIGPTTSARMDPFTPLLIDHGFMVMIGKGERNQEVAAKIKATGAVYFVCSGGISALLSKYVVSCETFAWEDLGAEAIHKLVVKDFPVYVSIV